jgi:small nuclear ribonucleoprotein (snRNP)-like protein
MNINNYYSCVRDSYLNVVLFTVKQQSSVIVERFGKFQRKTVWITLKNSGDRIVRVNLKSNS